MHNSNESKCNTRIASDGLGLGPSSPCGCIYGVNMNLRARHRDCVQTGNAFDEQSAVIYFHSSKSEFESYVALSYSILALTLGNERRAVLKVVNMLLNTLVYINK